jgi:hypothetical protein
MIQSRIENWLERGIITINDLMHQREYHDC